MNSISILKAYFSYAFHPFEFARYLAVTRASRNDSLLIHEHYQKPRFWSFPKNINPIGIFEVLAVSWIFLIINQIFSLTQFQASFEVVEFFQEYAESFIESFSSPRAQTVISSFVFIGLLKIAFAPVYLWFLSKFWKVIIVFFEGLFGNENVDDVGREQVVSGYLVSHVWYVVPLLGELLKAISGLIYLYAGLKENLGFTKTQSFIIILSPVFLGMTMFFMVILSFLIIFQGF